MTLQEAQEAKDNGKQVQHIENGRICGTIRCLDDSGTGAYLKPHYTFVPLEKLQAFDIHYFAQSC